MTRRPARDREDMPVTRSSKRIRHDSPLSPLPDEPAPVTPAHDVGSSDAETRVPPADPVAAGFTSSDEPAPVDVAAVALPAGAMGPPPAPAAAFGPAGVHSDALPLERSDATSAQNTMRDAASGSPVTEQPFIHPVVSDHVAPVVIADSDKTPSVNLSGSVPVDPVGVTSKVAPRPVDVPPPSHATAAAVGGQAPHGIRGSEATAKVPPEVAPGAVPSPHEGGVADASRTASGVSPKALPPQVPGSTAAATPASAPGLGLPSVRAGETPIKYTGIDYVAEDVLNRMRNIARVREIAANRYTLLTVPRAADWGRTPRLEKILCLNGKPVLIWIIGRVRSLWFFDRNGNPHLRVNIGVTLHSDEERAAAGELFARARPRADSAPATVYAARICSQREKGEYCDTPTPFAHVYDATTRLTAKSAMPQLSPVDLGKNDIVVMECTFTRWKRAGDGKGKKSWGSYDVGFELGSIFLLHSAPADMAEDDQVQHEEDIGVDL